jgi:SAM-dependent methyltransferase
MNIRETFQVGMDRQLPEFLEPPPGIQLNLGAGNKDIPGTVRLDADMGWWAPRLPYKLNSVGVAYAFHFLEHLDKDTALGLLREVERVLVPGGVFVSVTPHWSSECAFQDLDHKSFWTESTWKNLFDNPYYDGTMKRDWKLRVHSCVLMGLVQRNLVVVTQLVKG